MSKDYFDAVADFLGLPEKESSPEAPPNPPFPTDFTKWSKLVNAELTRIQDGSTKLRSPLSFGDKGIPAVKVLTRFLNEPSEDGLKLFLKLSKQDLGAAVTNQFRAWLIETVPGVEPFIKEAV